VLLTFSPEKFRNRTFGAPGPAVKDQARRERTHRHRGRGNDRLTGFGCDRREIETVCIIDSTRRIDLKRSEVMLGEMKIAEPGHSTIAGLRRRRSICVRKRPAGRS
jgi:hypothetical protein